VTIVDPRREQARAELLAAIAAGVATFTTYPRVDLNSRSLHEAWAAGDHEAVERWLDATFEETAALAGLFHDTGSSELRRQRSA
jgi:hypothetical protein